MPKRYGLFEADWKVLKAEIRQNLVDLARSRQVVTYSELTRQLRTAQLHPHSYTLAGLLREICHEEADAGRGLLCALVVTQQTGLPGGGFFRIAARRGRDIADPEQCWANEVQMIYDQWANGS